MVQVGQECSRQEGPLLARPLLLQRGWGCSLHAGGPGQAAGPSAGWGALVGLSSSVGMASGCALPHGWGTHSRAAVPG